MTTYHRQRRLGRTRLLDSTESPLGGSSRYAAAAEQKSSAPFPRIGTENQRRELSLPLRLSECVDRLQRVSSAHVIDDSLAAGPVPDWDHSDTADRAVSRWRCCTPATSSLRRTPARYSKTSGDRFPIGSRRSCPQALKLRLSSIAMSRRRLPITHRAAERCPAVHANTVLHIERKMPEATAVLRQLERLVKRARRSVSCWRSAAPTCRSLAIHPLPVPDDGRNPAGHSRQSRRLSPEKRGRAKRRSCPKCASKRAVAYAVRSPLRSLAALQPCRSRAA